MQISEAKIEEYKKIYYSKYGKEIDTAQVLLELTPLLILLESVYNYQNKKTSAETEVLIK